MGDIKASNVIYICITLFLGGILILASNPKKEAINSYLPTPLAHADSYQVSPEIEAMGAELGIPKENLVASHAHFGDAKTACGGDPVKGCFNGEIILTSADKVTLGHEYLHWVWSNKTSPEEKKQLSKEIMALYQKYPSNFDIRLSFYTSGEHHEVLRVGDDTFYNEMHSFLGTEISDSKLSPVLLNHYKQWLPNRNALPSYF